MSERKPDNLSLKWYVVGSPWLPPGIGSYIVAGGEDPHGSPMVVDSFEPWMAVENELYETEDAALDASFSVLQHICDLHNRWVEEQHDE